MHRYIRSFALLAAGCAPAQPAAVDAPQPAATAADLAASPPASDLAVSPHPPAPTSDLAIAADLALTPTACHLTINELQTGTGKSAADEWVELYNGCAQPVDIGRWTLLYEASDATSAITAFTFPVGASAAAHAFLLVVGTSYTGSAPADGQLASGLKATGGGLALVDAHGTAVDRVGWGDATNGFVEAAAAHAPGDSSPAASIARVPDGSDSDRNAQDLRVTAAPTPRAANLVR